MFCQHRWYLMRKRYGVARKTSSVRFLCRHNVGYWSAPPWNQLTFSAGCLESLLETTSPVSKGNYASVSYVTDATRTKIFEFPTGTPCGHFNILTIAQTFIRNSSSRTGPRWKSITLPQTQQPHQNNVCQHKCYWWKSTASVFFFFYPCPVNNFSRNRRSDTVSFSWSGAEPRRWKGSQVEVQWHSSTVESSWFSPVTGSI